MVEGRDLKNDAERTSSFVPEQLTAQGQCAAFTNADERRVVLEPFVKPRELCFELANAATCLLALEKGQFGRPLSKDLGEAIETFGSKVDGFGGRPFAMPGRKGGVGVIERLLNLVGGWDGY